MAEGASLSITSFSSESEITCSAGSSRHTFRTALLSPEDVMPATKVEVGSNVRPLIGSGSFENACGYQGGRSPAGQEGGEHPPMSHYRTLLKRRGSPSRT